MAEYSREKIGQYLTDVVGRPVSRVLFTSRLDNPGKTGYKPSRLFACLEGQVHLRCRANNGETADVFLHPGEILYAAPQNQVAEMWDRRQRMLAIIFPEDFTRLVYIDHDGVSAPPSPSPNPTCFYHILHKLNPVGKDILDALNYIAHTATPAREHPGGRQLLEALLLNIQEDFRQEAEHRSPHRHFLWNELYGFVAENFADPMLSRESLAKRFGVHATHISRMFRRELGMSFTDYVSACRFDLAVRLLRNPVLRINEIAESCGFSYSSYFIQAFRRRFRESPGEYRERIAWHHPEKELP